MYVCLYVCVYVSVCLFVGVVVVTVVGSADVGVAVVADAVVTVVPSKDTTFVSERPLQAATRTVTFTIRPRFDLSLSSLLLLEATVGVT